MPSDHEYLTLRELAKLIELGYVALFYRILPAGQRYLQDRAKYGS